MCRKGNGSLEREHLHCLHGATSASLESVIVRGMIKKKSQSNHSTYLTSEVTRHSHGLRLKSFRQWKLEERQESIGDRSDEAWVREGR